MMAGHTASLTTVHTLTDLLTDVIGASPVCAIICTN